MDTFPNSVAAAALADGQHFSLPGYGTLEGVYIAARINHVAREVDPPRLEVTWTQPALVGAQTLAELLVNTGATTQEAVTAQELWLDRLEQGQAVEVGDLGSLQIDSTTKLVTWNPDERGLSGAFWSSGPVAVEPLPPPADRTANIARLPEAASTAPVVVHKKPRSFSTGRLLKYAALFIGVLVGLAFLRSAIGEEERDESEAVAMTIANDRLNRSPLDETATGSVLPDDFVEPAYDPQFGPSGADATVIKAAPEDSDVGVGTSAAGNEAEGFDPANLAGAPPPQAEPEPEDTPEAYSPGGSVDESDYVIILGSFGKASNAARLTERLAGDGLLPFVDQPGRLTRVGVAFSASSKAEVKEMLRRMRQEYAEGAWLMD